MGRSNHIPRSSGSSAIVVGVVTHRRGCIGDIFAVAFVCARRHRQLMAVRKHQPLTFKQKPRRNNRVPYRPDSDAGEGRRRRPGRLPTPEPARASAGKNKLFSGEVEGLAVKLPDWVYPVVCRPRHWPDQVRQLRRQMGRPEAPRPLPASVRGREGQDRSPSPGPQCTEQTLADGSIKLTIQVTEVPHEQTIEIIVSPKGETTVTTKGFAGQSCRDASKFIEQALGQRPASSSPPSSTGPGGRAAQQQQRS